MTFGYLKDYYLISDGNQVKVATIDRYDIATTFDGKKWPYYTPFCLDLYTYVDSASCPNNFSSSNLQKILMYPARKYPKNIKQALEYLASVSFGSSKDLVRICDLQKFQEIANHAYAERQMEM